MNSGRTDRTVTRSTSQICHDIKTLKSLSVDEQTIFIHDIPYYDVKNICIDKPVRFESELLFYQTVACTSEENGKLPLHVSFKILKCVQEPAGLGVKQVLT